MSVERRTGTRRQIGENYRSIHHKGYRCQERSGSQVLLNAASRSSELHRITRLAPLRIRIGSGRGDGLDGWIAQ